MSMDRFSVCRISQNMFEEIKDIDKSSKRAPKQYLTNNEWTSGWFL